MDTELSIVILLLGISIRNCMSHQARQKCGPNEYSIVNASSVISCKPCIQCGMGYEPSPKCGSDVKAGISFSCVACREGYFKSLSSSFQCEECSVCATHQIYVKQCSVSSDALCGECQKGFFPSADLLGCQPCCACTGGRLDIKNPHCDRPRECHPDDATGKCRNETKSSFTTPTVAVAVQASNNDMILGGFKPTDHWSNQMFVITLALAGLVLLLILVYTILALKKRRREAYQSALLKAIYSSSSQASLAPFASSSMYPIDVPSVVSCPIKSCRENFCDELLKDVRVSSWSRYNLTKDEATKLYRSLMDCTPPKKDINFEDLLVDLEKYDASFKISTLIYYLQEIERNDILKAIHVSLHQSLETVPLTDNFDVT